MLKGDENVRYNEEQRKILTEWNELSMKVVVASGSDRDLLEEELKVVETEHRDLLLGYLEDAPDFVKNEHPNLFN